MKPLVTIAVPSYNQGQYLDDALTSIFQLTIPVEVFVMDGGSNDNSLEVIEKWKDKLAGWRSCKDGGQSAAINEGIALGSAPYVCWLNSDDWFLPEGMRSLLAVLEARPEVTVAYGKAWNYVEKSKKMRPVWVEPFNESRLAFRCIISQPATLIRRIAWDAVEGLDERLHMAMDYDLWWRLYKIGGPFEFIDQYVAVNREHSGTKTSNLRRENYVEAIKIVRRHYGRVPLKWWLARPYTIWFRNLISRFS
jgi:glycosyltransferase involved in cell wall biosynthesis